MTDSASTASGSTSGTPADDIAPGGESAAPPRSFDDPDAPVLEFTCPRCTLTVSEPFYGPCTTCIGELRASLGSDARNVQAEEYVPKMNVTPNAVALKD